MPEQATPENHRIYHIFLASPGDMNEERQMVREFFDGYNRNIANRQHLEFKVVDWENYSTIGLGRPQELITDQTLNKCKKSLILFIGLLGQRFGTPTGDHESGTEEEYETVLNFRKAKKNDPEIKWFFREEWEGQFPPDSKTMKVAWEQMEKVEAFKTKLQNGYPQFYTASFKKTENFQDKFRSDLERWLNDAARQWNNSIPFRTDQTEKINPVQDTQYLKLWFKLLALECAHLPLEILDARQGMEQTGSIGLPDIFVPLKAMAPIETWEKTREQDLTLARDMIKGGHGEPQPVLDLLAKQRLAVLIGDPGSGKSALVNQLTWSLLTEGRQTSLPEILQGFIPVRIILSRVEIPIGATQGRALWLWQALENDIQEKLKQSQQAGRHAKAVLKSLKQKLMQPPGGLILLDGLDEVPSADKRRLFLLQAIQALVASLPDHIRFIVTARPYAYTDPKWRLKDFASFFLTPFDEEQRTRFIEGWYEASRSRFALKKADLKQRIPDLIDRVEHQQHLRELAERPLLLTLIAILHASGGRLPEDRAQLYQRSVDLLLYRWRQEVFRDSDGQPLRLDDGELNKCLQTLAYNAHQAQRQQQDAVHTADISEADILTAFAPLLRKLGSDDLMAFLERHTGILIAREQHRFAFPHRSFQEYLAMCWLTSQTDDLLSPEVCADPLWWREVFLLAVIEKKNEPRIASLFIRDQLDSGENQPAEIKQRLNILAGLALSELKLKDSDSLIKTVRASLVDMIQDPQALNVSERAEAGRVLGLIGDPRKGVGLNAQGWPDIDWVKIPPGTIVLENDAGTFQVEPFYLARYPVTNAQFQAFLDDPVGYANPRWWANLDAEPGTPEPSDWDEANHPRETVSWFEAMAFCAWLTDRLGYKNAIQLPTEWQWQQAACSGQFGFDYPWGADYQGGFANLNVSYYKPCLYFLQRTTVVGLYPQGDSLQGVSDLCGNVSEWCINCYDDPSNSLISGLFPRVVRGGSWIDLPDILYALKRYANYPDYPTNTLGFRVCCLSPI